MTDTPRTDAETGYFELNKREVNYRNEPYVKTEFARLLERELAAEREKAERYRLITLRQDAELAALCNKLAALENQTQWECSCGGTACEGQKENAALREMLARAEVLAEYTHFDGRREWRVIECWVYPNDIIVQMDRAAFNAARKEAKL
jgi:hypothetical protein